MGRNSFKNRTSKCLALCLSVNGFIGQLMSSSYRSGGSIFEGVIISALYTATSFVLLLAPDFDFLDSRFLRKLVVCDF